MSESGNTSGYSIRTILRTSIVMMILVLFPLISWFYLRSGIDFRKEALQSMTVKSSSLLTTIELSDSTVLFVEDIGKRAYSIFFVNTSSSNNFNSIVEYEKQFRATDDVLVFIVLESGVEIDFPQESKIMTLPNSSGNIDLFTALKSQFSDTNTFLFDGKGDLRNNYLFEDDEQMRALITHTAVLLPPTDNRRNVRQRKTKEL